MQDTPFSSYWRPTSELLQPLYVRTRHRYRGPRESAKFALASQSMYADIVRLFQLAELSQDNYEVPMDFFNGRSGAEVEGFKSYLETLAYHHHSDEATPPSDDTLLEAIPTIPELRDAIVALEDKLDSLENQ